MSQATRILLSLVAGLVVGIILAASSADVADRVILIAQPIGTAWLNALQMTIVPLVVSLLITGVASTTQAARAGRITARAIMLFLSTLAVTSIMATLVTPLLLDLVPMPVAAAASLRAALVGSAPIGNAPPIAELLAAIVPTNVVAAAANSAFLSLIVFTLVFAFAVTRIEAEARDRLTAFFAAIRDAMLVVVNWVLWLAPLGVFALALVVGGRAGTSAVGALLHYILIVSAVGIVVVVMAYVLAIVGGGMPIARFARAALPAQAVAISTQSSLASLPAMLKAAPGMGVPTAAAGVVLPLAVAMFRGTQPAMNIAVSIYIAKWFGIALSPGALAGAVLVGTVTSLGSVSLPSQITFVAAIAPIAGALGVPLAPLGLLIAVETLPDIVRTLGNVTMDLAATVTVARNRSGRNAGDEEHAS